MLYWTIFRFRMSYAKLMSSGGCTCLSLIAEVSHRTPKFMTVDRIPCVLEMPHLAHATRHRRRPCFEVWWTMARVHPVIICILLYTLYCFQSSLGASKCVGGWVKNRNRRPTTRCCHLYWPWQPPSAALFTPSVLLPLILLLFLFTF